MTFDSEEGAANQSKQVRLKGKQSLDPVGPLQ